ncbi:ATP-binding cassette domain-containing protein [Conexibacter arvalis]|uniref:ABC-2 type transport system ATP-binding protein n=1 Tax=Conexibacter arvalis TaxID=912552 RepID=A0A840IHX8_9ACTN|nr:ATP-binding cassette domain-containing protein [Conexibacter arvalis]MBB4663915.1 ABC-2 type transport system ATP-binding protein [Conexibacter arvalis]
MELGDDPAVAREGDLPAIVARGLVKRFDDVVAVDGLDLRVPRGMVYCLLGPNGAGKTTAVRMLATLTAPDAGTVLIEGVDVRDDGARVRRLIGLTGQLASVDDAMSGEENLVLIARLLGLRGDRARQRARRLLAAFELADDAGRLVKTYSGGMRRRLDLAASLVVTPRVLFLDEPTTGLDPVGRLRVWAVVRALTRRGTTVLLTTQQLEEADALAHRIAVLDRGRVVAEGTPAQLKASVGSGAVRVRVADADTRDAAAELLAAATGGEVTLGDDPLALSVRPAGEREAARALAALTDGGVELTEFSIGRPTLDEVFLALTGRDETTAEAVAA